jgi:Pentapeptide repeats (8 copies)
VEQKPKTVRKQAEDLLSLLVADWRPTPRQVLWAVRIAVVLSLMVAIGYFYNITLWDWIKLLIIPAAIAAAGVWFNQQQREREQDIAQQHTQDEALQAYLDHISQLLTDKEPSLRNAQPDDEVRTLARARTLTVLARLDGRRKGTVVRFLYEANLIKRERVILDLWEADLSGADLTGADLRDADLAGTNLHRADLYYAKLMAADLREAYLNEAALNYANLTNTEVTQKQLEACRSLKGATMPDGSQHP